MDDRNARLAKARFIIGSLEELIGIAQEERADMLAYLLEAALTEALMFEKQARDGD